MKKKFRCEKCGEIVEINLFDKAPSHCPNCMQIEAEKIVNNWRKIYENRWKRLGINPPDVTTTNGSRQRRVYKPPFTSEESEELKKGSKGPGIKSADRFPNKDLQASRDDLELQSDYDFIEFKDEILKDASPCPTCGSSAESLTWFWFSSPKWTWRSLCGRSGWVSYCDKCKAQVDFYCVWMN